jgi:hypothetical protein
MVGKKFWSKREKVTGSWRKVHSSDLHDVHFSPSIIQLIKSRRIRWAAYVKRMGEKKNACCILVGKPEGKRLLERHTSRREDNI